MFLTKKDIFNIVLENRFLVKDENLEKITDFEKKIIEKAASDFGFEIKKEDSFFKKLKSETSHKDNPQAVLFVYGDYSINEDILFKTNEGEKNIHLFVCQFTQKEKRLEKIASYLFEKKLVILFPGLDQDYLSITLKETHEVFIFEEIKLKAKGKMIYKVAFSNGEIKIEELGVI